MAFICPMKDLPGVVVDNDLAPADVIVVTQTIVCGLSAVGESGGGGGGGGGGAVAYGFAG